ncbi:MAG: hypothetical protein ACKOQ5_07685 [Solirubrobacterales bacterium]
MTDHGNPISSLIGVYDADGSLSGELRYWVGAHLTGTRHCALCEITHGLFREKGTWQGLARQLPVPFEAVHLDERSAAIAEASRGRTPCVLAVRSDGSIGMLLGPEDLEAMDGDPSRLASALGEAIARGYPSGPAPT